MPDILSIDWERTGLQAVLARASREQVDEIQPLRLDAPPAIAALESTADSAAWLRERLAALGAKPHKTVIVLPREEVVTRRLELPDVPDADLPDVVRLQAATKLATPVDRLVLDFLPLPRLEDHPGRAVLVMTIDRDWFTSVTTAVRQAGLEPAACFVSPAATAELALRHAAALQQDSQRPALIVYQNGARAELSLVHRRLLVFSQVVRLSEGESHAQPLRAELARLLIALQQAYHGIAIEDVLLLHEGECDQQVLHVLEERFPGRVRECATADLLQSLPLTVREAALVSAPACGGALALLQPETAQIDFVRPRQRPLAKDPRKKRLTIAAGAAAAILLLGGYWRSTAISSRDDRIADLQQRKDDLDALLKRSELTLAAAEEIEAWQARGTSPLDLLADFQELLPGTDRMYLQSMSYVPAPRDGLARFTGTGVARTRSDKEEFEASLDARRYQVKPASYETNRRDPDYPIAFEIDATLLPPESEKPPSPAGSAAQSVTGSPQTEGGL